MVGAYLKFFLRNFCISCVSQVNVNLIPMDNVKFTCKTAHTQVASNIKTFDEQSVCINSIWYYTSQAKMMS